MTLIKWSKHLFERSKVKASRSMKSNAYFYLFLRLVFLFVVNEFLLSSEIHYCLMWLNVYYCFELCVNGGAIQNNVSLKPVYNFCLPIVLFFSMLLHQCVMNDQMCLNLWFFFLSISNQPLTNVLFLLSWQAICDYRTHILLWKRILAKTLCVHQKKTHFRWNKTLNNTKQKIW